MRQTTTLLVLLGLAALSGAQQPPTHAVTITLAHRSGQCTVDTVQPMTVEVDLGDKIEWTAKDGSGRCGGKTVTLGNFKLKDTGNAKDPVPGCNKKMTSGGAGVTCAVTNAAKKELFKYDVQVEGGGHMDPEIRVRG